MIGESLGPYRILAKIGEGGMGEVYRARDTRLGRDVALKVLPADYAQDADRRRRFELEARAVAALSHPHIVALYDVGEHDGAPYLVSELLEGETLAALLREGALPVGKAIEFGVQTAKGLAAAHARSIVHRDLKPANVFITSGEHIKILDFGIAKLTAPDSDSQTTEMTTRAASTEQGTVIGTVGYMSPEQVRGLPADHRTDIFSFGCVLYEMLSGHRAFRGDTRADTLSAILKEDPQPLRDLRETVSPMLQQVVDRCLEKRPENRFSSAHDLALALAAAATGSGPARADTAPSGAQAPSVGTAEVPPASGSGAEARVPTGQRPVETGSGTLTLAPVAGGWLLASLRRPWVAIGLLVLVGAIAATAWFGVQLSRARWARNVALPEILRLQKAERMQAAYALARQAARYLPEDPQLQQMIDGISVVASINSAPAGAKAYYSDYADPAAPWEFAGTTPITDTRIPWGFLRWKLEKVGFEPLIASAEGHELQSSNRPQDRREFRLFPPGSAPLGMVSVPGGDSFLHYGHTQKLDAYWIDRHEVTNAEFKRFVDARGYEKEKYWKGPFVKDGRVLAWKDAVALFKDKTGIPGPATWSLGSFPEGEGDLPVAGVSWHEAAAFAVFAVKDLPSLHHWAYAAGFSSSYDLFWDVQRQSNMTGGRPLPVSRNAGITKFGAYDMAGNVREWVWNSVGERRYRMGGGFDDPLYMFGDYDAASAFVRSPKDGFRCATYTKPLAPGLLAEVRVPKPDLNRKPVGDAEFSTYKTLYYSYDGEKNLDVKTEAAPEETSDWRHEKVSFDAGHESERMAAHLFLPRNAAPPYQVVVFLPDGYATGMKDSSRMDIRWFRFLVLTGRAVLCPVVTGTYERQTAWDKVWELTADWAKELGRSIDYLQTRDDIDSSRIALQGYSLGARFGPIFAVTEDRLKTVVVLAGGGIDDDMPPQADPVNFAPRARIPVLMVNGNDDFIFPKEATRRMFELLGTQNKKQLFVDGGHAPARLEEVQAAVIGWLDTHLGKVQRK